MGGVARCGDGSDNDPQVPAPSDHVQLGWRLMRELGDSNYTSEVVTELLDFRAIKGSRILHRNMSALSCCPSPVGTSLAGAIPSR